MNNKRSSFNKGPRGRTGRGGKRRFPSSFRRACMFCKEKRKEIDYKEVDLLGRFLNEKGRIVSRRSTGVCAKHQRKLCVAIKRARFLSLLPYIKV